MVRQPDDALLALLLGNAIGVMLLLSVWEMWLHNAAVHGWLEISIAFGAGALLYQTVQPFIPEFGSHHLSEFEHPHPTELEKVRGWSRAGAPQPLRSAGAVSPLQIPCECRAGGAPARARGLACLPRTPPS